LIYVYIDYVSSGETIGDYVFHYNPSIFMDFINQFPFTVCISGGNVLIFYIKNVIEDCYKKSEF
jgi:hypothetical protein